MLAWERWMKETSQRGGRFVFLQEERSISTDIFAESVILSADLLKSGALSTSAQDLIFVFQNQFHILEKINSILQGQRVLIGPDSHAWVEAGWGDFALKSLSADEWQAALKNVRSSSQGPLKDFRQSSGQPCLFLDRDDVVVKNVPYNNDPAKVELSPGIVELINKAHAKNWWVALVTNQSGLGRAKITWEEYQQVHQQMLRLLAAQGAWLDECVFAGHIEDSPHAAGDFYAGLRKPRPGMFQQVDDRLKVNRKASVMIGDSATDVMAAWHAGVGQLYLLETPRVAQEQKKIEAATSRLPGLQYQVLTSFNDVRL